MIPPGVVPIELPLPWELETVNAFLIPLADGWLLLDSGIGTGECFEALQRGLEAAGVGWRDIRLLVITHVHPDHVGLASRVLALSGAPLWMHRQELQRLAVYADPERHALRQRHGLTLAGVPGPMQARMTREFSGLRPSFELLHPDRLVEDGGSVETAIGTLEFLWAPGHSPGHLCLYQRERRLLFSGDQMLERITPNISWESDGDALGDYLGSLRALERMDIGTVVPSHGQPFTGHRAWVNHTIGHHEQRCDGIRDSLAAGPMTAHQLTGRLWRRELSPLHHHFAVLETLAHLDHMRRGGELASEPRDGALLWSPAALYTNTSPAGTT